MSGGPVVTLFEVGERLMKIGAYLVLAFIASVALAALGTIVGCAPAHVITKPVPVEVTKYVRVPIPPELTKPCVYPVLEPACTRNGKPELCNDQLLTERNGYRQELALCDADKTVLRGLK